MIVPAAPVKVLTEGGGRSCSCAAENADTAEEREMRDPENMKEIRNAADYRAESSSRHCHDNWEEMAEHDCVD